MVKINSFLDIFMIPTINSVIIVELYLHSNQGVHVSVYCLFVCSDVWYHSLYLCNVGIYYLVIYV